MKWLMRFRRNEVARQSSSDVNRAGNDNAGRRSAADALPSDGPSRLIGETVDQLCVCAVFDLPYIVRYVRQRNGLFRAMRSMRGTPDPNVASPQSSAAATGLPVAEVEDGGLPCAWCANNGGHFHCYCGAVVCGGRFNGKRFRCRLSCGAEWEPAATAKEIRVTRPRADWQAPAPPTGPDRLLPPAPPLPVKRPR